MLLVNVSLGQLQDVDLQVAQRLLTVRYLKPLVGTFATKKVTEKCTFQVCLVGS